MRDDHEGGEGEGKRDTRVVLPIEATTSLALGPDELPGYAFDYARHLYRRRSADPIDVGLIFVGAVTMVTARIVLAKVEGDPLTMRGLRAACRRLARDYEAVLGVAIVGAEGLTERGKIVDGVLIRIENRDDCRCLCAPIETDGAVSIIGRFEPAPHVLMTGNLFGLSPEPSDTETETRH